MSCAASCIVWCIVWCVASYLIVPHRAIQHSSSYYIYIYIYIAWQFAASCCVSSNVCILCGAQVYCSLHVCMYVYIYIYIYIYIYTVYIYIYTLCITIYIYIYIYIYLTICINCATSYVAPHSAASQGRANAEEEEAGSLENEKGGMNKGENKSQKRKHKSIHTCNQKALCISSPPLFIPPLLLLPRFYILQRGVQWKQGVAIYMMLCTSLLYNTTPVHCTPSHCTPL